MKRYVIAYTNDGRKEEKQFSSKAEAFKWFNWLCPAEEAQLYEEDDAGFRSPAKALRRRKPSGVCKPPEVV